MGTGAEWIKFYAGCGTQFCDDGIHSRPNFNDEEAKAICDEAHRLGRKVAAHAGGREALEQALKAGVDSIEHGNGIGAARIDLLIAQGAT
jgi:imidazolonepropionase-like amidohydrolase